MHKQREPDYYAARLQAERDAAAAATCDEARRSHLELAERYEQLLSAFGRPTLVARPGDDETTDGQSAAGISSGR
jgi:hypothetical protein